MIKINWTDIVFGVLLFIAGWLAVPSPFYNTTKEKLVVIHDTIKVQIPAIKDSGTVIVPIKNKKAKAAIFKGQDTIEINATIHGQENDSLELGVSWDIQPLPMECIKDTFYMTPVSECPSSPFFLKPEFAYPTGVAIGIIISYIIYRKYDK